MSVSAPTQSPSLWPCFSLRLEPQTCRDGGTRNTDAFHQPVHPALAELRDGASLCLFFTYVGEPEGGDLRQAPELAALVCIIRSFDAGRSWEQKPRTVHTPFLHDEMDGPFVRLIDGALFITYLATSDHRTKDARNNVIRCIRLRVRPDHSGIDLLPAPNRRWSGIRIARHPDKLLPRIKRLNRCKAIKLSTSPSLHAGAFDPALPALPYGGRLFSLRLS